MIIVYLALGSNVGDCAGYIRQAVGLLDEFLADVRQAPVYRSKAAGFLDQPDFLNTAVSGQTNLDPLDILQAVKGIEQRLGRTPTFRNGPREIDIDLILYGNEVLDSDKLTVPHPRFRERDFVLQPLIDLDSELRDPISGERLIVMLNALDTASRSIVGKLSAGTDPEP
ncbi:MAG: 2-amino-4-hydroxy-6-hydroxymethyldihydropteridine diphosphokinase [Candidatus Saccharimonadales bacterium]